MSSHAQPDVVVVGGGIGGLSTALGVCPERLVLRDTLDGSELSSLSLPAAERRYGAPYVVAHRSDLHVAYRGAVPFDAVHNQVDPHPADMVVYIGPGCHFVQYALRQGQMFNQVAVFRSARALRGEAEWGTPDELDAALADYQHARVPRTARVQTSARAWGDLWHCDGAERERRNAMFRARALDDYSYLDWLYEG